MTVCWATTNHRPRYVVSPISSTSSAPPFYHMFRAFQQCLSLFSQLLSLSLALQIARISFIYILAYWIAWYDSKWKAIWFFLQVKESNTCCRILITQIFYKWIISSLPPPATDPPVCLREWYNLFVITRARRGSECMHRLSCQSLTEVVAAGRVDTGLFF